MRLTDLDPFFIQLTRLEAPCSQWPFHPVGTLAEADGVMFLCPTHFQKNGAPGTHSVICWFKNRDIPAELTPRHGRWECECESARPMETLTLTPSVDLGNGDWHGWVKNGEVT